MLQYTCISCGQSQQITYRINTNLSCQHCGGSKVRFDSDSKILLFTCAKCDGSFHIGVGEEVSIIHVCGSTNYTIIDESMQVEKRVINFNQDKRTFKFIVPYYTGNKRVDYAIQSWVREDVVFYLTDPTIIPPGANVCSQIYSQISSKKYVGDKTLPMFPQIIADLYDIFPHEDYYGYFNSDIIIPQGLQLSSLLPYEKPIAFHHRVEVKGEGPQRNLKEDHIVVFGKDGFVFHRKVVEDIIKNFPQMIIGIPTWDTALAIYLAQTYGIDKIDLCYREIWHKPHMTLGESKERYDTPEGQYNQEAFADIRDKYFNKNQWNEICNEDVAQKDIKKRKTREVKKVAIIQPGRLGDIIICLPIAKHYHDEGYEVLWPCADEFIHLLDRIPYVRPINIHAICPKSYQTSLRVANRLKVDKIIDLAIGFGRDEDDWKAESFDQFKYRIAEVPFDKKYELEIPRNYEKEKRLKDLVLADHPGSYVVTHSKSSFGKYDFHIPNAVEIMPIKGFDIFDWIGIIEGAKMLFCVDSCVLNLANQLTLCEDRRYYWDWIDIRSEYQVSKRSPVLAPDWKHNSNFQRKYKDKIYPNYLWDDNAAQHILPFAKNYCKGKGIDIGGGSNSFPGVIQNIDPKGDYYYQPYDKELDFVFSSHMLEHLDNRQFFYSYSYNALKSGGYLFLYLPHPSMEYWSKDNPDMQHKYGHKHDLEPQVIIHELKQNNFDIISMSTNPDYYYSYYIVAQRPEKKRKSDFPKLSFVMIVLNGMPIIEYALKSIEDYAHEIIILEGAVNEFKFATDKFGLSKDGTTEFLKKYSKDNKKVIYLQADDLYLTKEEMHNECLKYVTGDYVWLIDSDEAYIKEDIEFTRDFIIHNQMYDEIYFPIFNFFKGINYIMHSNSEEFKNNTSAIRRIFKVKDGMKFIHHRPPMLTTEPVNCITMNRPIYHFGYCFDNQVRDKIKYYSKDLLSHQNISNWYHDFYAKWTPENRLHIEGKKFGVWVADETSKTIEFTGELPDGIKELFV